MKLRNHHPYNFLNYRLSHPTFILWLIFQCIACNSSTPVAKVGRYEINRQDLTYKKKLLQIYFPQNEATEEIALTALVKALTEAEILNENGHMVTEKVLEKESQRIDSDTKMPQRLAEIKAVFGSNLKAYLKDFVLPVYAQRTIYYDFFLHNKQVQKESFSIAERFLDQAIKNPKILTSKTLKKKLDQKSSGPFQFVVEQNPTKVPVNQLSRETETSFNKPKDFLVDNKKWIEELVPRLTLHTVFPQVIDYGESWLIVRLDAVTGKKPNAHYHFSGMLFNKRDYVSWHEEQKSKVQVQYFK